MAGDRAADADESTMSWPTPHRRLVGCTAALLISIVLATIAVGTATTPVGAQDPEFTVTVSDIDLDDPAGQTTVVLRLVPGSQVVAALSVELVHDPAMLTPTLAEPLSGGSCSVAEGKAQFGGFDPTGWTTPIDLCAFTYVGRGAVAEGTLGIEITSAVNAQVEPINGTTEPGAVRLGTPALPIATLTPTPPPPTSTPQPTSTPTPQPSATPEPTTTPAPTSTPAPTVTAEAAAAPTATRAASPSAQPASDGTESDSDRGGRNTPDPGDDQQIADGASDDDESGDPRSATPVPTPPPGDSDRSDEQASDPTGADPDDTDESAGADSTMVVTTVSDGGGVSPLLLAGATAALTAVGLALGSARRRTLRDG